MAVVDETATGAEWDIDEGWENHLDDSGPRGANAQARLHDVLLRATRAQVWRLRHRLPGAGPQDLEDLAQQAADDAQLSVLGRLDTFEGRSRFTTWAYKFGVYHAGASVRKQAWRHREVTLSDSLPIPDSRLTPSAVAEGGDLAQAVRDSFETALTPHQRVVMIALLIDEVPIDVLAERLGSSRNALYKNVHDARRRLRLALIASGHLDEPMTRSLS